MMRPVKLPVLLTTGRVDCEVSPAIRNTSSNEVLSATVTTSLSITALTGICPSASRSCAMCSVLPSRARR